MEKTYNKIQQTLGLFIVLKEEKEKEALCFIDFEEIFEIYEIWEHNEAEHPLNQFFLYLN